MKKTLLLTLLFAVAASAAITITFPDNPPQKVGVAVKCQITAQSSNNVDLFVKTATGTESWVYPTNVNNGFNGQIEITHPGTGFVLYASKGVENGTSVSFDVAIGDPNRWQLVAPGQTAVPGTQKGKTGTGSVTAGSSEAYTVNECDKWYNVTNSNPSGYTVTATDKFARISGNTVELRRVEGSSGSYNHKVVMSGGSYVNDTAEVTVKVGAASQLLVVCSGQTHEPGDTLTATAKGGKTGDPVSAAVGVGYEVTVYAVDNAWNIVPTYNGKVYINAGPEDVLSDTVDMKNGVAKISVKFPQAYPNGKEIYAKTIDGTLQSEYGTKVTVSGGIYKIGYKIEPSIGSVNAASKLTITVYSDTTTTAPNTPVDIVLKSGKAASLVMKDPIKDTTSHDSLRVTTIDDGTARVDLTSSEEASYVLKIYAGDRKVPSKVKDTTLTFTVKELTQLLIAPNPYKYSTHGNVPMNFTYKVEEKGGRDAIEVVLLIADVYGNLVYKATYDSGQEVRSGQQTIQWNKTNSNGTRVASGMYQAVLKLTLGDGSSPTPLKKNFMVIW